MGVETGRGSERILRAWSKDRVRLAALNFADGNDRGVVVAVRSSGTMEAEGVGLGAAMVGVCM